MVLIQYAAILPYHVSHGARFKIFWSKERRYLINTFPAVCPCMNLVRTETQGGAALLATAVQLTPLNGCWLLERVNLRVLDFPVLLQTV